MNQRLLTVVALLVVSGSVLGRPKEDVEPKQTQESRPNQAEPTKGIPLSPVFQNGEKKDIEDYATVARSSPNDPALSPSVAKVADQLIDNIGLMVDKDMRTPPKLKEIIKEKAEVKKETSNGPVNATAEPVVDKVEANGKFELKEALSSDTSEGKAANSKKEEVVKGVAVPVIMDEELEAPPKKLQKIPNVTKPPKEEKKKLPATTKASLKETPTTTPSSGLSTWILLSDNREATTPSSQKAKKTPTTTTKKPSKVQTTTVRVITNKPATKKVTSKPDVKKTDSTSALEAMVKNQKKTVTTLRPMMKNTDNKNESKKVVTIPPAIMIETTEIAIADETTSDGNLETTTKKKKTTTKKRKKNKNRRKKPAEKSGAEQVVKDLVKQPKQPVGAQFYNFLSREIMPTVGLGLVGVLVTAGLAGLLGYNPFNSNLPVRRTYESQHGYSPNHNYYTYNSEYGDTDGGQNEEVLFREVLSGMPEDGRYGISHSDASYPESQLYNSQEQAYVSVKNSGQSASVTATGSAEAVEKNSGAQQVGTSYSAVYGTPYHSYSNKDYAAYSSSSGGSYPKTERSSTTEKYKASSKYSGDGTIEKQPEALYRVSGDYAAEDPSMGASSNSDTSWHRIGSPMDYSQHSSVEPGPRRLNIDKMTEMLTGSVESVHKRAKRSPESFLTRLVRKSNDIMDVNNDRDNEIDVDDDFNKIDPLAQSTTLFSIEETTTYSVEDSKESSSSSSPSEEDQESNMVEDSTSEEIATPTPSTNETSPSLMDVVRRLAQFKLQLGITFLRTAADAFSQYLVGVQQKVQEAMSTDSSFPTMRFGWLGGKSATQNEPEKMRIREKRFQRNVVHKVVPEQELPMSKN